MKELSQQKTVKELLMSLKQIKKQPLLFVISSMLDAGFFFFLALITTPARDLLIAHAVLINNKLSGMQPQQGGLIGKLFAQEVFPLTLKTAGLLIILFALIYIVYTAFQGTSWWLSRTIAGKKDSFKNYFFGFARINLLWMAIYAAYKLIDTAAGMRHAIVQKLIPGTVNLTGKIIVILFGIACIAALLSYPLLHKKAIFKTPLRTTIPLIGISLSILLTAYFIHTKIGMINNDAGLLAGLIIFIPAITLVKVYTTRVMMNVRA